MLQPRVGVNVVSANRTAVRADVLRPRRRRSVHHRGLRRLPGPVPRGQLRRQGHLRRRRVRGGARRTACPRTRCSATTCSKASMRAPGLCTDIHLIDDYPSHVPGVRGAPAPLGAGRLADRALAVAHACRTPRERRSATRCRRSRAGRSSTTCGAACCRPRWSRCSRPAGRSCRARR